MKYILKWFVARIIGNFGVVEKGRVYRSAQRWYLYPLFLFLNLKTIINLSSKEDTDTQDRFERWFCKKLGIAYITYWTISPDYYFDEAYDALRNCDKPVLVHCEAGRDRTGGLIAVYKREVLCSEFTEIIKDWMCFKIPHEGWIEFLKKRL